METVISSDIGWIETQDINTNSYTISEPGSIEQQEFSQYNDAMLEFQYTIDQQVDYYRRSYSKLNSRFFIANRRTIENYSNGVRSF